MAKNSFVVEVTFKEPTFTFFIKTTLFAKEEFNIANKYGRKNN